MLIKVRYLDESTEFVRPSLLQYLIENKRIRAFLRRDGWVVLGVGQIRRLTPQLYSGAERRKVTYRL